MKASLVLLRSAILIKRKLGFQRLKEVGIFSQNNTSNTKDSKYIESYQPQEAR